MSRFIDERLQGLKAYIPGEQPDPGRFIKINTNEFPYPAAPNVENAARDAVGNMNLYCDLNCTKLKEEFFKVFGYGGRNVVFTNGSDDALYLCFLTFCGENRGAAFADITYGFYSVYADLCGVDKQIIPLDDELGINPCDYFAINRTVFIANPNAPTGKKLSLDQVASILENNKNNIVVIDEAYADFSGNTCIPLLERYDNLVIVGTFSKSRGMAGARLGYLIASEEIVEDIEKVKYSINPYNVNNLTQAVGAEVLRNNDYYFEKIREICNTRKNFTKGLIKLGFSVTDSYANFVFAKHENISGIEIFNKLRENGILIRRFDKECIKDYLRISIGTAEQMDKVLQVLGDIVGGKI